MKQNQVSTDEDIELGAAETHVDHAGDGKDELSQPLSEVEPIRKADTIPKGSKILCVEAFLQRFVFYGLTTPFQNYLQNPPSNKQLPGSLNLGESKAVAIVSTFNMLISIIPLAGGILADSYLGRYKTYLYGTIAYAAGSSLIFATSFESAIKAGAARPGFAIGAILVALGIGGVKSSETAYVADQYQQLSPVRYQKNGVSYVPDHDLTLQSIYAYYYVAINMSGLAIIVTPLLERYVGYWAAYLIPFTLFLIIIPVLLVSRKTLIHPPIHSTSLLLGICRLYCKKFKVLFSNQTFSTEEEELSRQIKPTLVACKIFLAYPVFYLCFNQISSNLVSQAGQMNTHGVPNDMIQLINPIACVILIPIFDKCVYPFLTKKNMSLRLITKILLGFLFAAISIAYAAGIQKAIYKNRPCLAHHHPCRDADLSHAISVFAQIPVYIFLTIAEVLAVLAGSQLAYKSAPDSMKALVQALYLLTSAFGSALNIALVKLSQDPYLVTFYSILAAVTFVVTVLLWLVFRNQKEE